ncbi:NmrA/HSCARG family protein [Ferruginibacter paludis]|uniref:NmrA/HSCARG family protein n=1 Tax=Ferruginibacter paludis TaxID=1310417 RepID=UPI0025B2F957|nr:NmrA/HSCARG family protein [Ferruginibacter paludis]MDN3656901.1 NmrA/HSCARG family protein [Ferruginibacter paludis]
MNQKKTILVTGATGAQGGSVAKALLAENNFAVRILTRNGQSEKALALQQAGAEVVTGDLDDRESIRNAMKGCYGVFGVTNFWEHFEKEYEQGKNLIDAVKEMNIEHFVLHTLPDYNKLSNGTYPTPHCDIKAALQAYTVSQNIPATFMQVAFYYENFFTFFPLQKSADGGYSFGFPQGETKLAMVSIDDLGPVVAAVFNHPAEYIGRTVGVVGADDTCYEYAAAMSRVLDKKVSYQYIPRDEYAALGFDGAEELANMFEVQRLYIPQRQIDLIESYGLNPAMQPFERWLIKNKNRFTAMMKAEDAIIA